MRIIIILETRKWTGNDGQENYTMKIFAEALCLGHAGPRKGSALCHGGRCPLKFNEASMSGKSKMAPKSSMPCARG